jgi:hypothetical protein
MNPRRAVLGVVVIMLRVGALAGYLYGLHSAPTKSTSETVTDAFDQVASSYANHLLLLEARNASALLSEYEGNATVQWKGVSGGCDGNYSGTYMGTLLGDLLNRSTSLVVSNETQAIQAEGSQWVVNSTFYVLGNNTAVGIFHAAIASKDSYIHDGGRWMIADETWNFLYYDSPFLDAPQFIC